MIYYGNMKKNKNKNYLVTNFNGVDHSKFE